MSDYAVAVIGGGAAGICAAISAARKGRSVVICEKMPLLGKKLLATGNGRCNLLNANLDAERFNPGSRELVKRAFAELGERRRSDLFAELGLQLSSSGGRLYPVTLQAASVLKV